MTARAARAGRNASRASDSPIVGRYDVCMDNTASTLTVRETAMVLGTDLSYTYHLIPAGLFVVAGGG
jgi:hypothetical protein